MTTQTEQQRSEALAKVLGIKASREVLLTMDTDACCGFDVGYLWLSQDYETLMKQAQKKLLNIDFNHFDVHITDKANYSEREFYKDRPSEEAATCAALYAALMAVGSK